MQGFHLEPSASGRYEFTFTVPENVGKPLKAIQIAQAKNVETIDFDIQRIQALASNGSGQTLIPIASVGGSNPQPGDMVITFAEPIGPGQTVTLILQTAANPRLGGIYELGVTAFPDGDNAQGQFLGFNRISFADL